jgi:site-specific DNA-methyltransferase (adenine-specific)
MLNKGMFSSNSDEWETPERVMVYLSEFFTFTLDPCATHENHKAPKYYTVEENGLIRDWSGETVFVNPPYSRGLMEKWVKKCWLESPYCWAIVLLIPARTDTRYWHEIIMRYASEVWLIKGRLRFSNSKNSAPFPSALVVFYPRLIGSETNPVFRSVVIPDV